MVTLAQVALTVGLVLKETVTSLAAAVTAGAEAVTPCLPLVRAVLTESVTLLSVRDLVRAADVKAVVAVSDG